MPIGKCPETVFLSRPGETSRTVRCALFSTHQPPCEAKVRLDSFGGDVMAMLTWTPAQKGAEKETEVK